MSILLLLRLGTYPYAPKDCVPKIPENQKPLDVRTGIPYLGEIRFDIDMMKCYEYTRNGWKEMR